MKKKNALSFQSRNSLLKDTKIKQWSIVHKQNLLAKDFPEVFSSIN